MSFRTRLLSTCVAMVLIPLALLALGVRREMTERLTAQYRQRVERMAEVIREDVAAESEAIAARLQRLTEAMADDNRLRVALLEGGDRAYLRDYASAIMPLSGLSMLQIQDETGRILSSGHFRHEYDRLEPELPRLLAGPSSDPALVRARTPEGPAVMLARADSLRLGPRWLTLVGGVSVEERFLRRLARDDDLVVSLVPDAILPPGSDEVLAVIELPYIIPDTVEQARVQLARLVISHPLTGLSALRRGVDRWFLAAAAVTLVAAVVLATWLSARLARPLAELARKTSRLDLDRLDVKFASDRDDEIGSLSRLLGAMTERLRTSAARLREAEHRATVGEVARQVNHDIKNGLAPIRNVLRHLSQLASERPSELPAVFLERRGTLESSVGYLETLAANYARLSPRLDRHPCDVNAVVRQAAADARVAAPATLRLRLDEREPTVLAEAVVLRRILGNLVVNAIDSLEGQPGEVVLATELTHGGGDGGAPMVRITVADTGRGMTEQELQRAFDDFYTTKATGTGLGLSIVRRLVLDLNGSLRVETGPGTGSRFAIEIPAASAPHLLAAAPVEPPVAR